METVGNRLKRARELAGLSRKALSQISGVGYSTIAELENNGMKSSTKLHLLARPLNVSVDFLAAGNGGYGHATAPVEGPGLLALQAALAQGGWLFVGEPEGGASLTDIEQLLASAARAPAAAIRDAKELLDSHQGAVAP